MRKTAVAVMFLLLLYFLTTSTYIVHEFVHLYQAGFEYSEFCFLGKNDDAVGWVKSNKFNSKDDEQLEREVNIVESIYLIISSILGGTFIGKLWPGREIEKTQHLPQVDWSPSNPTNQPRSERGSASPNTLIGEGSSHEGQQEQAKDSSDSPAALEIPPSRKDEAE